MTHVILRQSWHKEPVNVVFVPNEEKGLVLAKITCKAFSKVDVCVHESYENIDITLQASLIDFQKFLNSHFWDKHPSSNFEFTAPKGHSYPFNAALKFYLYRFGVFLDWKDKRWSRAVTESSNVNFQQLRELVSAKTLAPTTPESFSMRSWEAIKTLLKDDSSIKVGSNGKVEWKHKAGAWKNVRFGNGCIMSPKSTYSWSGCDSYKNDWENVANLVSYLRTMDVENRVHNQLYTYGSALLKTWNSQPKDKKFLADFQELVSKIEV